MEREYVRVRDILMETYKMSDMGVLTFYAGIKIDQGQGVVRMSQEAYTKKLLEQFGVSECCNAEPSPATEETKSLR